MSFNENGAFMKLEKKRKNNIFNEQNCCWLFVSDWSELLTIHYVTLHVYIVILHCYLMLRDLTCIYITWSYIMWPNTLGDLTLRENASWYVECWARASSDNSPFSEHPNCLNLNHNLSTSAMLTKTKQKIMHAKSVRIKN